MSGSSRPSRHEYYMSIAVRAAQRGTCPSASVGACLVNTETGQVSLGYNGAPPGIEHCEDPCKVDNELHCLLSVHAEINAILRGRFPLNEHLTLYTTRQPCLECTKTIISSHINSVIFSGDYADSREHRLGITRVQLLYDAAIGITKL